MAEPLGFFDDEGEALFRRGWPHLRLLVDGNKADRDPEASARKALEAKEPVVGIRWPRLTAAKFLFGLNDTSTGDIPRDPTAADLAAFLERHLPETPLPAFQIEDAIYLYEAFLGTDTVARALEHRLQKTATPPSHPAAAPLPFLRLRAASASASASPPASAFWLQDPHLLDAAPAWRLRRLAEELAPLRHPGVVRLMQRLATFPASRKAATAWLTAHADYVSGVLGDDDPARARRRSPKKTDATLKKVAATFAKEMEKARGDERKERKAIAKAIAAYVEIRALAEEPIPTAHVRRFLALASLSPTDEECARWARFVDEALEPYA